MRLYLALLVAAATLLPHAEALSLDRLLGRIFSGVRTKGVDAGIVSAPTLQVERAQVAPVDYLVTELPKVGYDSSLEEGFLRDEQLRRVGIFLINIFFNDGDTRPSPQTTKAMLMKQLLVILLKELKSRAGVADNRMLIAWDKSNPDTVIGCVEVFIVNQAPKIANLAVDPTVRRNGVASVLLDRCLSHVKEKGYESINLNVESDNEQAMRFYEKKGFIALSENVDQKYNVNGFFLKSEKIKKVLYSKKLSDFNAVHENASVEIGRSLSSA